jgi:hypothetical protein
MSRHLLVGFLLLPLLSAGRTSAQTPGGDGGVLSGIVHSEAGAPVPSASVALRRTSDSTLVGGSITAASGAFRIQGVAPGTYLVEVSSLGYRTATRSGVTVTASAERVDLGTIRLEPSAISLEGVEVSVARPPVTVLADRNVYSTSDMPAAAGGAATDVLRGIPELEVGVEGSVTTRGATPTIHINGRPPPMQGEALERYLQQLPADRIERVEVISNPSARYEAEGEGGIVNIVMKRGAGLGLSGSVAANAGTRSQRGGSGSVSYQEGRLTVFGSASASFSGNHTENSDLRQNLSARPVTFIQQDSRNRNSVGSGSVDVSAEVRVGSGGTLWADAAVGRNASEMEALTAYTHLDQLRNPTQRYDRLNDRDLRGLFGSSAAGFRHLDEERRSEWSLELRRTFSDHDDTSASARTWRNPDGAALDRAPELTFADDAQNREDLSLEASLRRGWGGAGQVEAGLRGSWRDTGSGFRMQTEGSGSPVPADEMVGDFRNRETIHAAFLSAGWQIGRLHLQAGVRGEQAEMRRSLPLAGESFETRDRDLFPSATLSLEIGAGAQLGLSYSKRVDRPWGGILNPLIPVLDPLNRRVGNPYLMPRHAHSLGLTATGSGRLGMIQLSPYYRRTVNSWDQVRTVDEEGVSTVTWQNLATISAYGGSLSASLAPVGRIGGFLNVSGYREVRDASRLWTDFSGSSTHVSVIGTASLRATSALGFQSSLTYLPARELPQGRISPMVFSTVGARLRLAEGRGSVNLSVVDPLELQRFTFTTRDRTHVQTGSSTFSARRAMLGISYSFGRPPQSDRPRGTPEEGPQENQPGIR